MKIAKIIICLLIVLILLLLLLIGDYTITKSGLTTGFNFKDWDWFAAIVAAFTLCITVFTWRAQELTRMNTTRLDANNYRDIISDGYYNIVRNVINIYSLSVFMEDKYAGFYPSEEYLQKLKLSIFDINQISLQNLPNKDYRKRLNYNFH